MNALPYALLQDARRIWAGLPQGRRLMLIGLAGALFIGIAFATQLMTAPDYAIAFSGLRDEDAAALVAKLKDAKIPYQLAEGGTIRIPRGQVQEAKLLAASFGLGQKGSGGGPGMEMFQQPHFGLTEFAEKINYQRALEGELSRTIGRLDAVEAARVHVVVPAPSLFTSAQKEPTASVVITTKPGRRLGSNQLTAITQLVAGSIEGLKAQNVSIMDTAGALLTERAGATDPTGQSDRRTGIQRNVESRIEDDISLLLTNLVGAGKAIVRVGATLDWDQYEASTETFSPGNQAPQPRTVRDSSELTRGGAGQPGGAPGVDSNVPTYPAGSDPRLASAAGTQAERRDTTTTYELSRTTEKVIRTPGGVKRLTIAVALNNDVIADAALVDAITQLVTTAAGIDITRGDRVTISALPFAGASEPSISPDLEMARQIDLVLTAGRIFAMVIGPLLLLLAFRLVLHRKNTPVVWSVAGGGQMLATADGSPAAIQGQAGQPKLPEPPLRPLKELRGEDRNRRLEQEIADFARTDPSAVAGIIRSWLRDDKGSA